MTLDGVQALQEKIGNCHVLYERRYLLKCHTSNPARCPPVFFTRCRLVGGQFNCPSSDHGQLVLGYTAPLADRPHLRVNFPGRIRMKNQPLRKGTGKALLNLILQESLRALLLVSAKHAIQ